jgi:thiol-disulfide isomerase/thioredoxin
VLATLSQGLVGDSLSFARVQARNYRQAPFHCPHLDSLAALRVWPPPHSGHCKSLKPAWKAAAADLVPHGIKLANVDATKETALASRFSVQGYPTIKVRTGRTQRDPMHCVRTAPCVC